MRKCQMHNALMYLFATIGFDTAEIEPSKAMFSYLLIPIFRNTNIICTMKDPRRVLTCRLRTKESESMMFSLTKKKLDILANLPANVSAVCDNSPKSGPFLKMDMFVWPVGLILLTASMAVWRPTGPGTQDRTGKRGFLKFAPSIYRWKEPTT